MAFVHGRQTKVLAAQYDLSAFLSNTDMTWDVDAPETTTYGNDDRTYITGLRGGSMSFAGFWDAVSDGPDDTIPGDLGSTTVTLVSYAPDGLSTGNVVYSVQSRHTNYSIGSPVDGVCTVNLDTQGTDRLSRGISLHGLTAETATTNANSVDNSASSSDGAIAYLHVTAYTGLTSIDISVYDSTDDAVFVSLIDFTQATDVTSERKTVTGTVDRYVRAEWTASGAGSCTFTIGFQRL
jgi:hypothetical protein